MTTFKDHFSSHAAAYAAYRPGYPDALGRWPAAITPASGVALDVGCGSGQLSLLLSEHFDAVIATDLSARQIGSAVRDPAIDYRVAPAEASGVDDASVDLLTAAQAAHWFDLPAFFDEARRVLKPGSIIALITYAGMTPRGPVEAICDHFRLITLKDFWPPERALVENHHRDIALPFTPVAAPGFAIEVYWPLAALIGYLDTWSAVREMERQAGREPFERAVAALSEAWGDADRLHMISWPLTIVAGRA